MKKIALIAASFALVACGPDTASQPNAKTEAAKRGAEMANQALAGGNNAEQDNIARRLKLTSNPGASGYVLLLNQAGQPIMYTTVKGKITSGSKRLTSPDMPRRVDCGQYCTEELGNAPSDEGTFGSSDPYIFFWTQEGQYIQWNGSYLYSDKPFRTNIQPLVVKVEAAKG